MDHTTSVRNPTEERALQLLGAGYTPEVVANSCGVTVGRISQLLSEDEFKSAVAALRTENLLKHNQRDSSYDALEDKLLEQLKMSAPMLMRPMEIAKVLSVINAAKRRGSSTPESITNQQTVVNIMMPTQIVQKFTTNISNQVISAGTQELLTIQSGALKAMSTKQAEEKQLKGIGNENGLERIGENSSAARSSSPETNF